MEFRESTPSPGAGALIDSLWTFSCEARAGAVEWAPIVPDGCVEIVHSARGPVESPSFGTGQPRAQRCGYILGVTSGPCHFRYASPLHLQGVRLRPAGAIRLFGTDLAALRDSACSLRELLPDLANHEGEGSSEIERAVVELAVARRRRNDDRVAIAMSRIMAANGQIHLSVLARDLAVSTRQLDRWFEKYLAMPPKLFCRIARFREAWRLDLTSRESWVSVAARCGYCDQAHLCREFREFAGQTPGRSISG